MAESAFRDSRDNRTVPFTAAEFGNVWAVHRGKVFGVDDLTPFQREWREWLAAHDAEVRAEAWDVGAKAMMRAIGDEQTVSFIAPHNPYRGEVRAGVVAEEREGRRWFSAAYRAQNGNIIPIGDETVLAEFAQKTVDEFARASDVGPDYFLASRIELPWVPVKQEGAGQ